MDERPAPGLRRSGITGAVADSADLQRGPTRATAVYEDAAVLWLPSHAPAKIALRFKLELSDSNLMCVLNYKVKRRNFFKLYLILVNLQFVWVFSAT